MIHAALASAYPTEAEARAALTDPAAPGAPYLGVWRLPEPYGGVAHVFGDTTAEALEAMGWTREVDA